MSYNQNAATESSFAQCDRCGIEVDLRSIFTEESGNHFCLTCWLGKEHHRSPRRRLTLVES